MRRCPACEAASVPARAVLLHLLEAAPLECGACGAGFVLHRRTRWGPFSTGPVYQVLLIGGVIIGLWVTAWWPFVVTLISMMSVEGVANWFGEPRLGDTGCNHSNPS